MIHDILGSSSVTRLKGILKNRYGMGLELSFLNDSGVVELNGGASSLKEGALQIPISSNGQFLAVAKIPEASTLSASSHDAITEIVRLILEPALYNWFLDSKMQNESGTFHRIGGLRILDATIPEVISERSAVVLLVSQNPHRIPRLAMQVHELMNRWAFVHWTEIRAQINSSQDLSDLGAMTILVDDILQLSPSEKNLLNDWIEGSLGQAEPALILGSSLGWADLKQNDVLPATLLHEAAFRQIEADRLPADRRFCEDAIKLLLDKEAIIHNH